MRRILSTLATAWALALSAQASEGRIYKVLPTLVDLRQRQSLAPSLFERDAYQSFLRKHPAQIGGRRFDIHWRASPGPGPLTLKLELRTANRPPGSPLELSKELTRTGSSGRHGGWDQILAPNETFSDAGEVVAWRARLLDHGVVIAEQRSFLW